MKRFRMLMLGFAAALSASVILNCGCAFAQFAAVQAEPAAGHCEHRKAGHETAAPDHEECCGRCHAEAFALTPSQFFLEENGALSFLKATPHIQNDFLFFAFKFSHTAGLRHTAQAPPGMSVPSYAPPIYLTLQTFLI